MEECNTGKYCVAVKLYTKNLKIKQHTMYEGKCVGMCA